MSETELSVICKQCGSEVSPYVTECPYCGARLRKRAPKLERRDGGLEPKLSRRQRRRRNRSPLRIRLGGGPGIRPYATIVAILAPAILLLVREASGGALSGFGAVTVPLMGSEWWRFLTAPFAYVNVGYLFVVALALAIFSTGLERRLGTLPTAALLIACGALGMVAGYAIENFRVQVDLMAGGNGMALGAIAAWFTLRRSGIRHGDLESLDMIGVAVSAAVILLLPAVVDTADIWAGLAGGAIGAICGLSAAVANRSEH